MNTPDLINAVFEVGGGLLCWGNVRRLLKDRQVKGVSWGVSAFFSVWSAWNCLFYPLLGQWFSFLGGIALFISNTTWVVLAIHFRKNK